MGEGGTEEGEGGAAASKWQRAVTTVVSRQKKCNVHVPNSIVYNKGHEGELVGDTKPFSELRYPPPSPPRRFPPARSPVLPCISARLAHQCSRGNQACRCLRVLSGFWAFGLFLFHVSTHPRRLLILQERRRSSMMAMAKFD